MPDTADDLNFNWLPTRSAHGRLQLITDNLDGAIRDLQSVTIAARRAGILVTGAAHYGYLSRAHYLRGEWDEATLNAERAIAGALAGARSRPPAANTKVSSMRSIRSQPHRRDHCSSSVSTTRQASSLRLVRGAARPRRGRVRRRGRTWPGRGRVRAVASSMSRASEWVA